MSKEERDKRLMELFLEGVELDATERAAFIERACGLDRELGLELASLLEAEAEGIGGFLDEPVASVPTGIESALEEAYQGGGEARPPSIDGYHDFTPLGEGGMGVVFRAEQQTPVRRTVAVKVIRAGMDSRTVLQRFEVERQALARMSHAYVASVYDAGADQEGRPFLVMEFVDGMPINEFCRLEKLDLVERVELCAKVCEAVEHAHRRGVLHRDLKPSNVLVIRQDGVAIPKIIDFGIAKSILGDLSEHTLLTEQGAFLGTPEYMSPEQFDLDASRIDTRTDIYALGVLIYEVLTGVLPFDSKRLRTSGLGRMVSILQTEVPPKPSTRLRSITGVNSSEAAPSVVPRSWVQRLRGELDWVVMKALAKDPDRRYVTPGALADDLRRFLKHEPVKAGPPSGVFRLRRFVRRYRLQVTAGALLLLSLIAGLTGTLWFLFEARRNEAEANQRTQEAIAVQRERMGTSVTAQASLVTEEDPNLALLLALEAGHFAGEYAAANAIYRALPGHDLVGSQNLRDKPTRELVFLKDGSLLARTIDCVFWRLDPDRSSVIQRFDGHHHEIVTMDVAEELGLVLTASRDASVRLWGMNDGQCRTVLEQGAPLVSAAFSPDRRLFASLTSTGIVRVYDRETANLLHEFGPKSGLLSSIDFHPTEPRILMHSRDGSNEIRSTEDGRVLRSTPPLDEGEPSGASHARFSPDGSRIVREHGRFDPAHRVQISTLNGDVIRDLHDGRLKRGPVEDPQMMLLDGEIIYVSLESGETVARLASEPLLAILEVSPDGEWLVGIDAELNISLFDAVTGEKVREMAGTSDKLWRHLQAAFHPDGRRFTVSGPRARVWAIEPEYAPLELFVGKKRFEYEEAASIGFGPQGALALSHGLDEESQDFWTLWNVDERRRLRTLRIPDVTLLYLSEDGMRLLGRQDIPAEGREPRRYRFKTFDLEGRLLNERIAPREGTRDWIGPNGSTIATVFKPEPGKMRLQVMDLASGTKSWDRELPETFFHYADAPGQGYAATHTLGGRTEIFDLKSGEVVRIINSPPGYLNLYCAVDPVERRVLVAQANKAVRAFDLDSDSQEPTGEYSVLLYSDKVRTGLIPGTDLGWSQCANEVHIYHAVTCRPFAVLRLDSLVFGVYARPDGSEILTITETGLCQRWPMNPLEVAERKAVEGVTEATLELFGIGTPEERRAHEQERYLASPSPNGMAKLAERALREDGDLDAAIDYYHRSMEFGPLGRVMSSHYRRLLELLCQRISATDPGDPTRAEDIAAAAEALKKCLFHGMPIERFRAHGGFEHVEADPAVQAWLGQ